MVQRVSLVTVLLGLVLQMVGCSSSPRMGKYDIELQTQSPWPSCETDIVGIGESDVPKWSSMSSADVDDYFANKNGIRESTAEFSGRRTIAATSQPGSYGEDVITVDAGTTTPVVLSRDDEVWDQWKDRGFMYAVLVSNRSFDGGPAAPFIIPLATNRWSGVIDNRTIVVHMLSSEIKFGRHPKEAVVE